VNEILTLIGNILWISVPIAFVVAIIIFILKIKKRIQTFTNDTFGLSPKETVDMLKDGYKQEAYTPKAITSLTEVYAPKIKRDFPQIGYNGMEALAKNSLLASLNAIEAEGTEIMKNYSPALISKVQNIIDDNRSRNIKVKYDNIKIHKCGIASYKKMTNQATATFEISLQYHLKQEINGKTDKKNNGEEPTQSAYRILLSYDQKEYEKTSSIVYTSTCPNCGAPINVAGENKVCSYCGSGFTEIASRIWQVTDFNLIK